MPTAPGAIVTGAGRGIGHAAAKLLAARGWPVGCLDIDRVAAAEVAKELRGLGGMAQPLAVDVTDRAAVLAAVEHFGEAHGIRALVNNAMWISFGPVEEMAESNVDHMLGVGIKGALWCLQAALPFLVRASASSGDAAVVNVASAAAFQGTPGYSVYAGVKGALVSMSRQAAVELGPRGVRVNAVAPGPIPTEAALAATPDATAWRTATERRTPLRRMGTVDEVASVISFLCGPESKWVNGQAIAVDGGKMVSSF